MKTGHSASGDIFAGRRQLVREALEEFVIGLTRQKKLGHTVRHCFTIVCGSFLVTPRGLDSASRAGAVGWMHARAGGQHSFQMEWEQKKGCPEWVPQWPAARPGSSQRGAARRMQTDQKSSSISTDSKSTTTQLRHLDT